MKELFDIPYQFRVNVLREKTEWRRSDEDAWQELDDRALNTIYFSICQAGNKVNFKELERYLYSDFFPTYHPFHGYLNALPAWDGRDRVDALARRVSNDELWQLVFHRWMRAMVAQWMDHDMLTANSMVPVLVSRRQGLGKSTFWRQLMPPELAAYYLDKLDFTATGEYDRMMAQCGIINLDELNAFSDRAMAKFKAATQMKSITHHSTHTTRIAYCKRLASFCATTNEVGILHDYTGSRRFFCVNVQHKINCSRPIDHAQLYAQLVSEIHAGEPTWFSKNEERRIERHNAAFYRLTPLQHAILRHYHLPEEGEGQTCTAQAMFNVVARHHPALLAGVRLADFGRQVARLFPVANRRKEGRTYRAIPMTAQNATL